MQLFSAEASIFSKKLNGIALFGWSSIYDKFLLICCSFLWVYQIFFLVSSLGVALNSKVHII